MGPETNRNTNTIILHIGSLPRTLFVITCHKRSADTFDGRAVLRHDVARQGGQGDGHEHHQQASNLILLLWADVFCYRRRKGMNDSSNPSQHAFILAQKIKKQKLLRENVLSQQALRCTCQKKRR